LDNVTNSATTVAISALTPVANMVVFLNQDGREGLFECVSGTAPSDPLNGLYIPSSTSGFYWARVWDGIHGRPEWFGAVTGNPNGVAAVLSRTLSALQACVALCPVTELSDQPYYVNNTFKVSTSLRKVQGAPSYTKIICTDPSKDVIQVGPDASTSQSAQIELSHVSAGWAVPLTPPTGGNEETAPKAFRVQYNLTAKLVWCFANDAFIGYYFYGNINSHFENCYSVRSLGYGGAAANDFHVGFWLKGNPHFPGYAGGNASMFFTKCNATCTGDWMDLAQNKGFYANGDYADTFVNGFETSKVHLGIEFDGGGYTSLAGHGDVSLKGLVLDNCYENGIYIHNDIGLGKLTIDDFYIQGPDHPSGDYGKNRLIRVESGFGKVMFGQGRVTGSDNSALKVGIFVYKHGNVTFDPGTIVDNIAYAAIFDGADTGCDGCAFLGTLDGGLVAPGASRSALALTRCTNGWFAPRILGRLRAWEHGINLLGNANDKLQIDTTRVSPESVASTYRVRINNSNVALPGPYTGAGAAGSAGQGILVSGITQPG